ncbi:MAG: glycosyltransferase [Candidatus Portnoybacteria bacterium]|nr:glycosyltransferase [Candidatus Portnoybacteria bacterium]
MKILVVTQKVDMEDDNLGFFHAWLLEFAEKFEKIIVICLEKGRHELPDNVEVFSLGKETASGKRTKYIFKFFRHIWRKKGDYDAVFVHMNPEYIVLAGWLWKLWGKKISLWYTHKKVTWKLRLAEKFADFVFTASPESCRISSSKIMVTGHGIDTEKFKPGLEKKDGKLKILTVGRISPSKGLDTLIEAASVLRDKEDNNFEILIAGAPILKSDHGYLDNLREKITKLGLKESVKFVGPIPFSKIDDFYLAGDVFVNLSATGSIDKTVLEAMACGLPVLTSNEAFVNILESKYRFAQGDYKELVEKVIALKDVEADISLREFVVKNHNLRNLIEKIASVLKNDFFSKEIQDFYDSQNRSAYESKRWFSNSISQAGFKMTKDFILRFIKKHGSDFKNYLELGPGSGVWTELFIQKNPGASFDLVDISEKMLDAAQEKLGQWDSLRIKYVKGDFADFVADKKYDLFFSSRAFEYLPEKKAAIQKISEILNTGGRGLIITKNPRYIFYAIKRRKVPAIHRGQISPARLCGFLAENGFSEIKIYPVSVTFPIFRSAGLNMFFYKILSRWPLNFLSRMFCEAYGAEFVKK